MPLLQKCVIQKLVLTGKSGGKQCVWVGTMIIHLTIRFWIHLIVPTCTDVSLQRPALTIKTKEGKCFRVGTRQAVCQKVLSDR